MSDQNVDGNLTNNDAQPYLAFFDPLTSSIVGLFLESLLFGVFVMTYAYGTWVLLRGDQPHSARKRNRLLLAANTLMVLLALVNLCLALQYTLYGSVTTAPGFKMLDNAYLRLLRWNMARFYMYVTQTLIGDGFMIYRLFIVWNRRRVVLIVPIILILIDAVAGYNYLFLTVFSSTVFFSFSFFTNMLSSILIMWRVLRSEYQAQDHWEWHSRTWFNLVKYRRVLSAIIQSAAIYSIASITLVITSFISPNIGYGVSLNVFPPLIGIVFAVIVIQIAHNTSIHAHGSTVALVSNSSGSGSGRKELHTGLHIVSERVAV